MPTTPKYIIEYIQYLRGIQKTYPDAFYARYNLSASSKPTIDFKAIFGSNVGWTVQHINTSNKKIILTEKVEPSIDKGGIALPPISFDNTAPLVKPTTAPPNGYFILQVENLGLPPGYAANTHVLLQYLTGGTISNFAPATISNFGPGGILSTDAVAIDVPFRGQYELPLQGIQGTSNVELVNPKTIKYSITASNIKTTIGEFKPSINLPTFIPKNKEYRKVTVTWTKVGKPDTVTMITPPVLLPEQPLPPPTEVTYPSTSDPAPKPIPLGPSRIDNKPFEDPENTFRATGIEQMFSFDPNDVPQLVEYAVGVASTIQPIAYRIRNNTVSHKLQFDFTVPSFLDLDASASLQINPQEEVVITVSFIEEDARNKSKQKSTDYSETFKWSVTPLNVTGPVFVKRKLTEVQYNPDQTLPSNPPPIQPAPPLVGQIGGNIGFDGSNFYFTLEPSRASIVVTQRRPIRVDGWIGGANVNPNQAGSLPLQFGTDSVIWESNNPSILTIDNQNGNGDAVLVPIAPGLAEIKATIIKQPANITDVKWNTAYDNITPIAGTGNRILYKGIKSIQIVAVIEVFTSKSQIVDKNKK